MKKLILSLVMLTLTVPAVASEGVIGTVLVDQNNEYSLFKTAEAHPVTELEGYCLEVDDRLQGGWLKFGEASWESRTNTCKVSVGQVAANKLHDTLLEQVEAGTLIIQ